MGKRKRGTDEGEVLQRPNGKASRPISKGVQQPPDSAIREIAIQVVTGSYERALHGITVHIRKSPIKYEVSFSDSFLFNAHTSAMRCLALSPPSEAHKVFLATGGTDERIKLYSLSTIPPPLPSHQDGADGTPDAPSSSTAVSGKATPMQLLPLRPTSSNPANREIGTLNHHSATVTRLAFPTRTKLLSAAADNSVAVLRTRDWEVLSLLRAPIPRPVGRPSGDTAVAGEAPAGINDVAVHPSLKLMITVGRGERCMRLWNLVTGKKAGVLQFDRSLLALLGEGSRQVGGGGEGQRVVWDAEGEEFAVAFERAACVFGVDSKPRGIVRPQHPPTKIHQMRYHYLPTNKRLLVLSTEDGRLLFFSTAGVDIENATEAEDATSQNGEDRKELRVPECSLVAQLSSAGPAGRIKDFTILSTSLQDGEAVTQIAVTARSDGSVQVWALDIAVIAESIKSSRKAKSDVAKGTKAAPNVAELLGTYKTNNRITCMEAFVLDGKADNDVPVVDGEAPASDTATSSSGDDET